MKLIYYCSRLREEPRKIRFLLSRLLWASRLCHFFVIDRVGYILRFYPTSLSASLWVGAGNCTRQIDNDEEFLAAYLKKGDVVCDIGANIGSMALRAAYEVGASGCVLAFEPHPRTFEFLRKNISLNNFSNVLAHNVAIGERENNVRLENRRSDDQNQITGVGQIRIQLKTLDGFTGKCESLSLLKIDVEGYEKFVLMGASKTIQKTACIYFESYNKHFTQYGYSTDELLQILRWHGFRLFRRNGNALERLPVGYGSDICENLIAVRDQAEFLQRTGYVLSDGSS